MVYPILRKVREGWGPGHSFMLHTHRYPSEFTLGAGSPLHSLDASVEMCELSELSELSPGSDDFPPRRDDLPAYVLRVSERPVGHPAFVSSWPAIARADIRCVAFLELSKLLNQEDALSAPWLRVISALRRRTHAAERRIRHFDVTLPFATPKPSCRQARCFSGGGRQCTGRATSTWPSRGAVKRRSDIWILVSQ